MAQSILPVYHELFSTAPNVRILIYSGDVDSIVPFVATRIWLDKLNMAEQSSFTPWYLDGQVAGCVVCSFFSLSLSHPTEPLTWAVVYFVCDTLARRRVMYYDKLTFSTVRNSGHMVPGTQPARSLRLFERFLRNENL